jgi:pyruvate formate-lyase activating enzyme-like uncharacterized protein
MEHTDGLAAEKLELIKMIIETEDVQMLQAVHSVFVDYFNAAEWEMSDELYAELKERTRLREEGKMETYRWEEVRDELLD